MADDDESRSGHCVKEHCADKKATDLPDAFGDGCGDVANSDSHDGRSLMTLVA
jgi:hypothetical protein